jgi:Uncharacterised nucleotidyltransferase
MVIDCLAAEVVDALRAEAIESIVVKGPAIVHWLYDELDGRGYADADVLVPPDKVQAAEGVLARRGFRREFGDEDMADRRPLHAHQWRSPTVAASVDIHRTFTGIGVPPAEVWPAFRDRTTPMRIGGSDVLAADRVATAMLAALHAAWHGRHNTQPLRDLSRAVTTFDDDVWRDAARFADRLDAMAAFAAGLRLDRGGAALAETLGLPSQLPFEIVLTARHPQAGAVGLYRLATTPGLRPKAMLVWRKLVPSVALMRSISPLARRGRVGMAAAYAGRPVVVLWRTGFAMRALWLARKETR